MFKPLPARFGRIHIGTGPHLHYAEFGDAAGEPILFLHGWPDSWFSFSRVLPILPPRFRAIAVDQRGYGDSDRPESGYAVADFGEDAVAVLDAMKIPRAVVVGHSFGSFVARHVALAHPDRLDALVLIGTGLTAANEVTGELQISLRDLPDPIPEAFARDFQASTAHRPLPPEFFDRLIFESLKLPPRLWRVLIDRLLEYDDSAYLAQIACPTLLLWGDHDALFSRSDQDRFIAARPGTQLRVYQDAGHCPNWEVPESLAADIEAFVS
jgi:non-heme chloroperoxidase